MKTLIGFLISALAVAFLAGCGSSGGGGSNTSGKCSSSNPTMPSMKTALKDIFPQSLLNESYQATGINIGYFPISDIVSYKTAVTSKGFDPFQNEAEDVSYLYSETYSNPNIPHVVIFIYDNGAVEWYLGGSTVDVYETDFDLNIFPSTGTSQADVWIYRHYDTNKSSSFNTYIGQLEDNGFNYDANDEEWIKESDDKCFVYYWSNNGKDDDANWGIYSKVY